jgi:hypothetical protein
MTESRRIDPALLLAPLVIVAWLLWPPVPFEHSLADVALAFPAAYALFFLARFLSRVALSFIGRTSPQLLLSMSFLGADAVSLLVRFSVAAMTTGVNVDRELRGAALDSLWCTVAIAIVERKNLRRPDDGEGEENGAGPFPVRAARGEPRSRRGSLRRGDAPRGVSTFWPCGILLSSC